MLWDAEVIKDERAYNRHCCVTDTARQCTLVPQQQPRTVCPAEEDEEGCEQTFWRARVSATRTLRLPREEWAPTAGMATRTSAAM